LSPLRVRRRRSSLPSCRFSPPGASVVVAIRLRGDRVISGRVRERAISTASTTRVGWLGAQLAHIDGLEPFAPLALDRALFAVDSATQDGADDALLRRKSLQGESIAAHAAQGRVEVGRPRPDPRLHALEYARQEGGFRVVIAEQPDRRRRGEHERDHGQRQSRGQVHASIVIAVDPDGNTRFANH
jgi:hypothetical protein